MNDPDQKPDPTMQVSGAVDGTVVQASTINGLHIYTSAPPSAPAMAGDAFTELVDALLTVPCVRDAADRSILLARLRPQISSAVAHHPRARLQVIELVRTCQDYDDGLNDLLRVLRELEGDSIPVRRSAEAMRALVDETSTK